MQAGTEIWLQGHLDGARQLVLSRLEEKEMASPLLCDEDAEILLTEEEREIVRGMDDRSVEERRMDAVVTHFVDNALLEATSIVNPEHGDYNQVVLFSLGLDTRPFRLPWPKATIIYEVASKDVHTLRKERLKKKAPYGCLHIPVMLQDIHQLHNQMERAGFRGDRLSVWAVQGLHLLDFSQDELEALFVEISQLSKCKSLIIGEVPRLRKTATVEFLAQFSLVATVTDIAEEGHALNRLLKNGEDRCVFRAQQQLHSAAEREIYAAHVQAAEETDEDFLDNFS